jgi:hypothetical protein
VRWMPWTASVFEGPQGMVDVIVEAVCTWKWFEGGHAKEKACYVV